MIPSRQTLPQGGAVELVCAVTGEDGDVSDLTYVWEKVRDEMDPGTALVSGSRLTISPLAVSDRGLYVCTVTSWCGRVARSSAVLEVEPRELPSLQIYPAPSQTVASGGSVMLQCRWGNNNKYFKIRVESESRGLIIKCFSFY